MSFVSRLARSVAVTFIALVAGLLTAFAVARLGTATEIYSGMEDLIWVVWGLFAGACVGLLAAVLVAPRLQLTRLAGFTIGVVLVVVSLLMVRGSGSMRYPWAKCGPRCRWSGRSSIRRSTPPRARRADPHRVPRFPAGRVRGVHWPMRSDRSGRLRASLSW